MEDNKELKKFVNDGKIDLKIFKQECSGLKDTLKSALRHKKSKQSVYLFLDYAFGL